ncbi:hypothetical protein B0H67DRAFT_550315 [Lasiosphaeris hirsuta]|uniref:Uncharacterized protein n=1 Tax=Lasiosphaeris hirsuta TaxID=260670 RepID=A0AA40E2G5_9PEZI|nr:hypothetical protein B0H67DRAFT_550315 [Lasiosphaeris hirsuta]
MPVPVEGIGRGLGVSLMWAVVYFLSLVLDTVVGIAIAFGWAGPYIAATVYEALVDWEILEKIQNVTKSNPRALGWRLTKERHALAITLVGALEVDAHFVEFVKEELKQPDTAYRFLKQSCMQLVPFGVHVGVPVMFYVTASIYSLIDAQARFGDNDTAHAIAFGLWYCTIILVAIMSSMVLSAGAGHIAEAATARCTSPHKGYRLRWICERRCELGNWSRKLLSGDDGKYSDVFEQHGTLPSAIVAVLILMVPLASAFTIAYLTPEIGVGCRSATVLAYAISQVLLILLWLPHSSPTLRKFRDSDNAKGLRWCSLWAISVLYYAVGSISACVTIAGTVMQMVGVYRNCLCKAGLLYGLTTAHHGWDTVEVKLSTDTQADRDQAQYWMVLGGSVVAWLVVLCTVVGWHRVRMRQRCLALIDTLR